eukprot:Nk52_evm26s304 gene=Nk52_evmTU26s304
MLAKHRLGIPHVCIPALYSSAHSVFMKTMPTLREYEGQLEEEQGKTTELMEAGAGSNCSCSVMINEGDYELLQQLVSVSKVIVMISAECYTAWNARKVLMQLGLIDLSEELAFISFVFTKHPKTVDGWLHRQWVLSAMIARGCVHAEEMISQEMQVCDLLATQYAKNYYAWTHRQFVLNNYCDNVSVLLRELYVNMGLWTMGHVSDNCGFHHKEFLILKILNQYYLGNTIAYLRGKRLVVKEDVHVRRPSNFGSGSHGVPEGPKKLSIMKSRKFMIQWFDTDKALQLLCLNDPGNLNLMDLENSQEGISLGSGNMNLKVVDTLLTLFYDVMETGRKIFISKNTSGFSGEEAKDGLEHSLADVISDFEVLSTDDQCSLNAQNLGLKAFLLKSSGFCILLREYFGNDDTIKMYPEYETVWCYRRFLVAILVKAYLCISLAYIVSRLEGKIDGMDREQSLNSIVQEIRLSLDISAAFEVQIPFLVYEEKLVSAILDDYLSAKNSASPFVGGDGCSNNLEQETLEKKRKSCRFAMSFFVWCYAQLKLPVTDSKDNEFEACHVSDIGPTSPLESNPLPLSPFNKYVTSSCAIKEKYVSLLRHGALP